MLEQKKNERKKIYEVKKYGKISAVWVDETIFLDDIILADLLIVSTDSQLRAFHSIEISL
jgi:hypothetical protein